MGILGSIVDWEALVETVGAALVAGVGIAIAFSFAIYGVARFAEARRAGAPLAAGVSAALAAVALIVCAGAITFGVVVMASG
ncbi:MAG: hypothetical protein ACRDL1_02575 [Solirubrobacterales bacterium]